MTKSIENYPAERAEPFEEYMRRHFELVYHTAISRLKCHDAAEDLTQEVFLRAWLHWDKLTEPERSAAWVCRVTRNLAIDWLRNRQRRSKLLTLVPLTEDQPATGPAESLTADQKIAQTETNLQLQQALFALPAELCEIILLHYADGLNQREIAANTGSSPVRVHRLMKKALSMLKKSFEAELHRSVKAFAPRQKSLVKTTMLIASAAALNVPAKSALAAAAGNTASLAAGAKSGGLLIGLFSNLFSGGAILISMNKPMIVAAMLVVLAGGGATLYLQDDSKIADNAAKAKNVEVRNAQDSVQLGSGPFIFDSENPNVALSVDVNNAHRISVPISNEIVEPYNLTPGEIFRLVPLQTKGREKFIKEHWGDMSDFSLPGPDWISFLYAKPKSGGGVVVSNYNSRPKKACTLHNALKRDLKLYTQYFAGPAELLQHEVVGDWIIREDSTPEERLRQLEKILLADYHLPVRFVSKNVERDVVTVNGTYRNFPLAETFGDAKPPQVQLIEQLDQIGQRNVAHMQIVYDFSQFLFEIGDHLGLTLINQVDNPQTPWSARDNQGTILGFYQPQYANLGNLMAEPERLERFLKNLELQTSLKFRLEKRTIPVWFVEQI